MRHPRNILHEAELTSSSPERVFGWLEAKASEAKSWSDTCHDEKVEKALLARSSPLINLALARFSIHKDIVRELFNFQDACHRSALRIAALSNQALGKVLFGDIPNSLYGDSPFNEGEVGAFMKDLSAEEIIALFENPTINDGFLTNFLEQKDSWGELDEENQQLAIQALTRNPRISKEYDGIMDGWAEYSHGRVFDAGWELAAKIPVTVRWAAVLGSFYEKLQLHSYSINDPMALLARWRPIDAKDKDGEAEDVPKAHLGPFARVRRALARLATNSSHPSLTDMLGHADHAVRAAAYIEGHLTAQAMLSAIEKDGSFAINEMVWNESLWRTAEQRKVLHDAAWASGGRDGSSLDDANMYNAVRERMRREHPAWFNDEDDLSVSTTDRPATIADVDAAVQRVETQIQSGLTAVLQHITGVQLKLLGGVATIIIIILLSR